MPIPEVYILWHPGCAIGEELAKRIHGWLRPGNGLGPQVFYRSLKSPEAPPGGLPPPLPGERREPVPVAGPTAKVSNVQIVVTLIDANLVVDPAWREWLARLGDPGWSSCPRFFVPVALDATAYNVPAPLRNLNFLRPSGLPFPVGGGPDVTEITVRSLLKQLTETLCRFMLGGPAGEMDGLPKLKIFLSHAKVDGTVPARRLRDYIYSQTQLAAFYDENDIAYGALFARVLEGDLSARETAALIAVRSGRYASRPWCRRELGVFRRPRKEPGYLAGESERWRLYPTLVVDALAGGASTPGIPELGNSTHVRWDELVPDQEEQIVTTVLRDVMLSAFHSALGGAIELRSDQIAINWLPDPTTLLLIDRVRSGDEIDIIHPGRGLSGLDLRTLEEYFPQLTFYSFEEVLS